uniref:ANAPC4_WD40 domain-containing protein n=1 Tax=Heterorhabditis bacteriophora TaxID=37862 RepID=A0A1I7WLV2_HETBA
MDLRVELSSDRILNARWKVKTKESTFLGVRWDPDTDHLLFFVSSITMKSTTKIILLQQISPVFDLLGLI